MKAKLVYPVSAPGSGESLLLFGQFEYLDFRKCVLKAPGASDVDRFQILEMFDSQPSLFLRFFATTA